MKKEKKFERYLFIKEVASITHLHPQTLRYYEKMGLIEPCRSQGNIRLYSLEDVEKIKKIKVLTQDLGVNLAGVEVIFKLTEQIEELRKERDEIKKQLEKKSKIDIEPSVNQ
ncbi:MAG: MerR family transcriptional regulator, heat shock protein HspR [Candidatus Atribacteria bacterium]|nr:MerR family transcriptional regulator, heat shock protein HspR [Candidatus Atribacteria bacterium]